MLASADYIELLPVARTGRARWCAVLLGLVAGAALVAPGAAQTNTRSIPVTEESVDRAVQAGVDWIKTQRKAGGDWEWRDPPSEAGGSFTGYGGDTSLALMALLYAGENPRGVEMTESLRWLADQELAETYTVGSRAHVLAIVPGNEFRDVLRRDLQWLLRAVNPAQSQHPGSYNYLTGGRGGDKSYDNSNSQYAVLGVWMASDAGLDVPGAYWELIARHWLRDQNTDGGWGYRQSDGSNGSMTAAGLATLYVVFDRYFVGRPRQSVPVTTGIEDALQWLGEEFSTENPGGDKRWRYYYLYGVERVGRAGGYKYFRDVDWFHEGARFLLSAQNADGSWGAKEDGGTFTMSKLRNTAFALMFLCHGRAPLLYNKLEVIPPDLIDFDPPENLDALLEAEEISRAEAREIEQKIRRLVDSKQKARDVAGLQRYAQNTLERLLNWQIVTLDSPLADLLEAPVLYMNGQYAWEFTDEQVTKLRAYCDRGGLIFTVPHERGTEFVESIRTLATTLYPEYTLTPLPAEHPIFSGEVGRAVESPPEILELSNGLRTLMLVCTEDISEAWNRYVPRRRPDDFSIGLNIYLYAIDKTTPSSRLAQRVIEPKPVPIEREVRVARIQYAGRWDPEPHGWERLAAYLNNEAATRLSVVNGVRLDAPELRDFNVAHLTGADPIELTGEELSGLRRFVAGGGTLIVDALGGSRAFTESIQAQLAETLRVAAARLPDQSPIITGTNIAGATELTNIGYRREARRESRGRSTPRLLAYQMPRHVAVVVSPLDISTALLGTEVYGSRSYDGPSALRIMRNLLLYGHLSTIDKARVSQTR